MVDQAQVTATEPNGRTASPRRAVTTNTREFLGDVVNLAELQSQLMLLELRQSFQKTLIPVGLIVAGVWIALCGILLALGALAIFIDEWTTLTLAQSILITAVGSLIVGGAIGFFAIRYLTSGISWFSRTIEEGKLNLRWLKLVMKQGGKRFSQ